MGFLNEIDFAKVDYTLDSFQGNFNPLSSSG